MPEIMNKTRNENIPIILTGATGVGKTEFSLALAEEIGAEIISVDSRLVYRGLDIGTDKPGAAQRSRVAHHLIDVINPGERFTVSDFVERCNAAIEDISKRGKVPLLVGGTCMYINALRGEFVFGGLDRDEAVRRELEAAADAEGDAALHARLAGLDPESAARIHENDRRRIVRALEVSIVTGETLTERNRRRAGAVSSGKFIVAGVCRERINLYERINKRTITIYNNGLIGETDAALVKWPGAENFFTEIIGYAQALRVIREGMAEDEAIERTAQATRAFARRQLTWFRRMKEITWMNLGTLDCKKGIELIKSAKTNLTK